MRGGRVCPGLTSERGALLGSTRGAALLRGDSSAAERAGAGVSHRHFPQIPTLLSVTPKQNLSQEQRIFPFAHGQPRVFCLGVLGRQLQRSEK